MSLAWYLPTSEIAAALALDLLLGDPRWIYHPVRLIGAGIELSETSLWTGNHRHDLWRGAATAIAIVFVATIGTWLLISIAGALTRDGAAIIAVILAWTTIALRGLNDAAAKVEEALDRCDLDEARTLVSALVGRDPLSLDRDGIVRAVIESVAENSSDGVIAPLLYLFVGGPAAAMAYKAINTLDSMIGHTDERHLYFGRWAARMDDIANLIPARFSAVCLIVAAAILREQPLDSARVCLADARQHLSPNAGFPEAAMAGALGIQLGGPAVYDGKTESHPTLGFACRRLEPTDIARARHVLWTQSLVAFAVIALIRAWLGTIWAR